MENVSNDLRAEYYPFTVLVAYKSSHHYGYYIESHPVNKKGQVLAGKPLDHQTMDMILESFERTKKEEKKILGGSIPNGLLHADQVAGHFVWFIPAGKRTLYFKEGLEIPDGLASIPPLIFSAKGGSLSVFAFTEFEGDKTQLYRAPFHNVNLAGHVCLGSATTEMKGHTFQDMLNYWETKFFASVFTHLSSEESPVKGNINMMWKKLIETESEFDTKILIKTKIKMEDLLK